MKFLNEKIKEKNTVKLIHKNTGLCTCTVQTTNASVKIEHHNSKDTWLNALIFSKSL
jgi:hypothetical protein